MADPARTTRIASRATTRLDGRSRAFAQLDQTAEYAPNQSDTILGRYRIMDARGTGGFGTVLTCWDTRLQRRVAIKRMSLTAQADVPGGSSTVAEGLAEARTSSLLAHPNIVTVFDFERDAECAYLVMEYVDGITLSELLSRVEGGTLTPSECAYLMRALGSALAFAHENGVLHLDIKPTNIMINRSGVVKLCDFGMATLASATGYGDARGGTVGYMPPEQIEGGIVDERTDVFSLAVVCWQALTGENPFMAPTAEQSLKLIERGPKTKLSKLIPDASGMCEEALLGALDPNPAMRTPSIADFTAEVSFALGDPDEGAESIRHLLSQTGEAAEDPDDAVASELPLAFRFPWIEGLIVRLVSLGSVAWLALRITEAAIPSRRAALMVVGACCALTCVWPAIGSALVLVFLSFALLTVTSGAAPILLAGFFCCLALAWWALVGARERQATPATLLPFVLASPIAGASWAAVFLRPAQALVTAAFSWASTQLYLAALAEGFVASGVAHRLVELALSPAAWIAGVGCALATWLGALVSRVRPTTAWALGGEALCTAGLIGSQLLAARVENGGIWAAPSWDTVGVAVVLWVLASLAIAVCGPRPEDREDDYDELV